MDLVDLVFANDYYANSNLLLLCTMCMKRVPKIIIHETEGEVSIRLYCSCSNEENTIVYDIDDYIKTLKHLMQQNISNQDYCAFSKSNGNNTEEHSNHELIQNKIIVDNQCINHPNTVADFYCNNCFQCLCKNCCNNNHHHLDHSFINLYEEANDINLSIITNELEQAMAQFKENISKSKEFVSILNESNEKEAKKLNSIVGDKIKANRSLLSLSLLIIHTYKFFSPIINYNLLQNIKLINCNKRKIHLKYNNDEESIQAFKSYYSRNYLLLIKLEKEFEVRKIKERVDSMLTLNNGNVALLTFSQAMLLYDSHLIHRICEIPQINTEYCASNLLELINGKIIGKAGKTVLVIWDFNKVSSEAFDYPSSFYLYQLTNGLVFSEEWGRIYFYNIDTKQINTQFICSQDEENDLNAFAQVCLELFDGNILFASVSNVLHVFDQKSLRSVSKFAVEDNVRDLKQVANGLVVGVIGCNIVVLNINQMVIVNRIHFEGAYIEGITISSNQKLLIFSISHKDIVILDYMSFKPIYSFSIKQKISHISYCLLIDGRMAIGNENSILFYDRI